MVAEGLSPDDPDFDISGGDDVTALLLAEEWHFWHRARNRVILRRLAGLGILPGKKLLELGCGAGCVASALAQAGYQVTGVEGHRPLVDVACRRAHGAAFVCHDLRQGPPPLADAGAFDAVGLFDVIEHVERPQGLLTTALDLAAPTGMVIGTVPALMSLWSRIDEHAGHKTRYSRASLRTLLTNLGDVEVIEIGPFFRSLVPLVWVQRRVVGRHGDNSSAARNLAVPWSPVNHLLDRLCALEERFSPLWRVVDLPGASLWFALRRHS